MDCQPALVLLGEMAIARQLAIGVGLGDVPKLLATDVGFVESDHTGLPFVATMIA